jgi:hypothetical protein
MGKLFLWFLIIVIVGYGIMFGVRCIKVRLDYSNLKDEAKTLFSPNSNVPYNKVPDRLLRMAKEQDIPLKEGDIDVYIDDWEGVRVIKFHYLDSVPIFNYRKVFFDFSFADTVLYTSRK